MEHRSPLVILGSNILLLDEFQIDKHSLLCFAQDDRFYTHEDKSTKVWIYNLQTKTVLINTRHSFAHDENPVCFYYDYETQRVKLTGFEPPSFEINLETKQVGSIWNRFSFVGIPITTKQIIIDKSIDVYSFPGKN